MIDERKLIEFLREIEKERPYKIPGQADTYCQYNESWQDCIDRIESFIESQPKIGEWIPCSERLPECEWGAETDALLYQHKGTGSIEVGYYGRGGKFRDSYFRHYRNSTDGVDSKDVIAWQPLPAPYEIDWCNI